VAERGATEGDPSPDGELITRSLTAPELFGVLFDRHAPSVGRFLARRTMGGDTLVEDLLAETFLTAFRIRAGFDPSRASARPWLFGIATRTAQRSHRDDTRRWSALARAEVTDSRLVPACFDDLVVDRLDAARVEPALASALSKMRDDDRTTLLLLAWSELSYAEIAEALDIPIGTVRSRIFRGRRQLRASLAAQGVHSHPHALLSSIEEHS
jgi:RNA polymerase sigma-70 factor (ECF subfamily)